MGSSNFNLQQSINHYISLIQIQGSITPSDAAELTAHLYDATDALKQQGLSEEEAFTIACKRLGNEIILAEEYSKVNTSVHTNKVWAYLFIGFNLLYALPSIFLSIVALLYHLVYKHFNTSLTSVCIITAFHLVFTAFVWYIVKSKKEISRFIEKQVDQNNLRFVCITFIPLFLNTIPLRYFSNIEQSVALRYPVYAFNSSISEFSFYIAIMSIIAGTLSLIFSINKTENLTISVLFQKPSVPFLFSFGVVIELFAASTRSIRMNSIAGSAITFGLIYMAASFLIAFYNKKDSIRKYLIISMLFGFLMEIGFGFIADTERGDTYYTVYFVSAMILGIVIGSYIGIKLRDQNTLSKPEIL